MLCKGIVSPYGMLKFLLTEFQLNSSENDKQPWNQELKKTIREVWIAVEGNRMPSQSTVWLAGVSVWDYWDSYITLNHFSLNAIHKLFFIDMQVS